jgi:hypothetical protein
MKGKRLVTAAIGASAWVGFASPAHADAYIGIAIYDPPGPQVEITHQTGPTATLAEAAALATCNARYDTCQAVGTSPACISVVPGPGISWVYGIGADLVTAEANAMAKGSEQGWTDTRAITHCADGE